MSNGALSHFLRVFCAQERWPWPRRGGQLSCSSGSVWPPSCTGWAFLSTEKPDRVCPGEPALSLCLRWGVSGWWSADAVTWDSHACGPSRWSHALREQWPAGNSHFHTRVAIPRHDGNCTRLFFFFFFCQKKAGWMGSDSFVRKVWKLVAESKSGGVWGDEQGTGYKAVVMCFSMLCSAYSSN